MRETFKKIQPGVEIRDGDAYNLPVEDASANAIICAQALFNLSIVLIVVISLVRNSRGVEGVC
jgi:ubiquinone/menaquinone biosynthesis C-methylase UbiE